MAKPQKLLEQPVCESFHIQELKLAADKAGATPVANRSQSECCFGFVEGDFFFNVPSI